MLIEDTRGSARRPWRGRWRARWTPSTRGCSAPSDLLPADLIGTNVFNQREARFEFHPGPVFANVVLVDEINRASPKTQSGLLECMQERRVTVDGPTHELARPFLVIATQNPIEYEGTYPLPEAAARPLHGPGRARLPDARGGGEMLAEHAEGDRVLELEPVVDVGGVIAAQAERGGGARERGAAPLRGRALRGDPGRPAGGARREPPRRADAVPGGEGARRARGARPRPARRRAGAGALGARAPPAARLEVDGDQRETVVRDAMERVPAL